MRFILPSLEYEQKAKDFIREFYEYSSEINGTGGLDRFLREETYALWLEKVRSDLDIANTLPGKAAAYTYFYLREDDMKIIGMVNIRLELTDFLRKEGGHIGYSIRPTERGKGYGTKMLREVLKIFGRIGINSIIVTCDKKNIASAGVIKNCGGVLDSEFYSKTYGEVLQRYSIAVCSEK